MLESLDREIKLHMTPLAKSRKAKATNRGIYKKDGVLFWGVSIRQYSSLRCCVMVKIKPWHYDELLLSITHPEDTIHFTDKLRWDGFSAMSMYCIEKRFYPYPEKDKNGNIDQSLLSAWCQEIYENAMEILDSFCAKLDSEYGDLDGFHIANSDEDLLTAAFAYISRREYQNAERLLIEAQERNLVFNRSYGSYTRDIRDVLLDYCKAQRLGQKWTSRMVVGKVEE